MDIRALKLSGDCRGEQHLRQAALLDLKRLPLDLLCSSRDSKETEKSKNNILPLSNLSKSLLLCFSILFLGAIIRSGVFSQGATLPSLVVQCYRSQAMDKCCNGFGWPVYLSICLSIYLSIASHLISSDLIHLSISLSLSIYEIWHLLPYLPRSEATTTRRPYWRPSCRTLKRWCRKGCSPPWTGMEWPRSPLADAVNVWKSVVRRRCVKMGGF